MKNPLTRAALAALLLPACASPPAASSAVHSAAEPGYGPGDTPTPMTRISGIVGIMELDADLTVSDDVGQDADVDDRTVPMIGAAWQRPFRAERLELGIEAGFTFGWESDREAVAIDTGTVVVLADNDFKLLDLSFGAYASTRLGERLRLYGGVGPVVQFAWVDLELDEEIDGRSSLDENGIGYGYYARLGAELDVGKGTAVGLVVRWLDTEVDLGGALEDFETEGIQVGLVVTNSF